jgi:transcriptional regulator GlxA family with amidase domain
MEVDGHKHAIFPGCCAWMEPGRVYPAGQDLTDRLGVNYIHFELHGRGGRGPLYPPDAPTRRMHHVTDIAFFDACMRRVINLHSLSRTAKTSQARTLLKQAGCLLKVLLMELESDALVRTAQEPSVGLRHRRKIHECVGKILEDPAASSSVAALARACGVSVDHFSRLFHRLIGATPKAFMLDARLRKARELLRESDLPVKDIAARMGYSDVFFFSRQFRLKIGQSPAAFRRHRAG